jgi:hypothetical protein
MSVNNSGHRYQCCRATYECCPEEYVCCTDPMGPAACCPPDKECCPDDPRGCCPRRDCAVGQELCAGSCVNSVAFRFDRNNCGRCGNTCAPGEWCCNGVCYYQWGVEAGSCPPVAPLGTVDG